MRRECYEMVNECHCKFWTIEVVGCHYLATFGRIGTNGQTQTKSFRSMNEANWKANAMIRQKKQKGYIRVADDAHPGASKQLLDSLSGGARTLAVAAPRESGGRAIMLED